MNFSKKLSEIFEETFRKKDENSNILSLNKSYENLHKGKRCFILGNGPSLKEVDFSLLQNEYVFTVNRLMNYSGFDKLKSNFHIYADLEVFGLRKALRGRSGIMMNEMLGLTKQVELFLPVESIDIIKRKKYDQKLNISYFKIGKPFVDGNHSMDLSKTIPGYRTVIHYAITIAIYMGFNEIYLLGCDGTTIKSVIDVAMNLQMTNIHAYDDDEMQNKTIRQLLNSMKMENILYDQYCVFHDFRLLHKYCFEHKIKLINLCETSIIDTIPKRKLLEIL